MCEREGSCPRRAISGDDERQAERAAVAHGGICVEGVRDRGDYPPTLVLRQRRNAGVRNPLIDESVAWKLVDVLEQHMLEVSEASGRDQLGRPVAAPPARPRGARLRLVDRVAHASDRGVPVVAMIPAEAEAATPSPSGIASAEPSTPSSPSPRRTASIRGSGSTATTRTPSAATARVSFPVPAPSSTTSSAPSATSQRAASSGHSGRARSYAPAWAPNVSRRGAVATWRT